MRPRRRQIVMRNWKWSERESDNPVNILARSERGERRPDEEEEAFLTVLLKRPWQELSSAAMHKQAVMHLMRNVSYLDSDVCLADGSFMRAAPSSR